MTQANLETLDAAVHGRLRVRSAFETTPHFVQIMPEEFTRAATSCPIVFTKDPDNGRFYAGVIYGFKAGENLLLGPDGGVAGAFVPFDLQRQGFFVVGDAIAIDPASPRFSTSEGHPLFDDDGQPAPATRNAQRLLGRLMAGIEQTEILVTSLTSHGLIEPVDISLRFDDGETIELRGLYSVSLDRLADLADDAVLALFRSGHLQLAYTVAQSLNQVGVLADRRNSALAAIG